MTSEIVYEDLVKNFKVEGGKLWRFFRGKYWKEVSLEANDSYGYCQIQWNGKKFKAHRILYSLYYQCNVDTDLMLDHIDGNRINNSKENLRLVDNRQNQSNRTKHRKGRLVGCTFDKRDNKWHAQIKINKKVYHLGLYPTEIEANKAYLVALECLEYELTGIQIQEIINELRKENCL